MFCDNIYITYFFFHIFSQIEGLVIVDLERGQVQICDTVQVPSIPSPVVAEFKEK